MRTRSRVLVLVTVLACLPAAFAAARVEKMLALPDGATFALEADAGSVTLTGTDRADVKLLIEWNKDLDSEFNLSVEQTPAAVRVKLVRKGSWLRSFSGKVPAFTIEVPARAPVSIDTSGGAVVATRVKEARLETSGGDLKVADVSGPLSAETSGGDVDAERIEGDATLETSGGDVRASAIRGGVKAETSGGNISLLDVAGDVGAETSGGSIEIVRVGGRIDAETSGGSIRAEFGAGNFKGGRLETSGGSIDVRIDPAANLVLDGETSGGSVTSDVPVTVSGKTGSSSLRGKIGNGGPELVLRTSGGSIHVAPLTAR
ncbi:MAG: DUF4097 family beta strand repeat protein [Acidobacteria bacterium]|nr:DUF4097 family beta strand repeat protein [Acidobacteriota bacterium]